MFMATHLYFSLVTYSVEFTRCLRLHQVSDFTAEQIIMAMLATTAVTKI